MLLTVRTEQQPSPRTPHCSPVSSQPAAAVASWTLVSTGHPAKAATVLRPQQRGPASPSLRSILSRDGGGLAWLGRLSAHVSTLDIFLLGRYLKYIPADHVSFPRCRCSVMSSSYAATQKQPSRRYLLYSFHIIHGMIILY